MKANSPKWLEKLVEEEAKNSTSLNPRVILPEDAVDRLGHVAPTLTHLMLMQ